MINHRRLGLALIALVYFTTSGLIPLPAPAYMVAALRPGGEIQDVQATRLPNGQGGTPGCYLPFVSMNYAPFPPDAPEILPIQNADGDNYFTVAWKPAAGAETYTLEEAYDAAFTNAVVIYTGPNTSMPFQQGKSPAAYYYRVRSNKQAMASVWSGTQSIIIYPLHVGLSMRWDGTGTLYFDEYAYAGTHEIRTLDRMIDADSIGMAEQFWYDPNPIGWEAENHYSHYHLPTGNYETGTYIDDPDWKWSYPWRLAYWSTFTDGETVNIGGQPFTVKGPFPANPSDPIPLSFWQFVNQGDILFYSDAEGLAQIVHPGKAVLRYDSGPYGLLIHDDVRRDLYYYGEYLGWWVQYSAKLTSMTTTPASNTLVQAIPEPGLPGITARRLAEAWTRLPLTGK